jgi:hypothetical protein
MARAAGARLAPILWFVAADLALAAAEVTDGRRGGIKWSAARAFLVAMGMGNLFPTRASAPFGGLDDRGIELDKQETGMLLRNKNAVIYGGGGAIGGAVAHAFAREGARVFLAGRTRAKLDQVAREISAAGGTAQVAEVDALDEKAVDGHADAVTANAGAIDIALNAVGIRHVQGTPFAALSFQDHAHPINC